MKYNGFEVNDDLIDKYVESLEISIDEVLRGRLNLEEAVLTTSGECGDSEQGYRKIFYLFHNCSP